MTMGSHQRSIGKDQARFTPRVGMTVRPNAVWADDPNCIPTGEIMCVASWGDCGAVYVKGDHRAFAAYVFEPCECRA